MLFFLDMDHGPNSLVYQFYGFAHIFFFALVARCLAKLPALIQKPFWFQFVSIMILVFAAGGIIELIQPCFGRSSSWRDVGFDLVGGFLGLMFLAPSRHDISRWIIASGRLTAISFAGLLLFGPAITIWNMNQANRQFPILGDFENRLETRRWSSGNMDRNIARHGHASLRVALNTGKKYSGTTMLRDFGNWTEYSFFAFSIHNPDHAPLSLTVSIRDHEHFRRGGKYEDRFNQAFPIEPGWNDIRIPIQNIENAPSERSLELNNLSEVVFFTVDLPKPRVINLDYVRLIP